MKQSRNINRAEGKRMKKAGVGLAFAIAVSITTGSFASDTTVLTRAVTKLIKANQEVNIMVNDLKEMVEYNSKEIASNKKRIESIESKLTSLESDVKNTKKEAEQAIKEAKEAKSMAAAIAEIKKETGVFGESAKIAYKRSLDLQKRISKLEIGLEKLGELVHKEKSANAPIKSCPSVSEVRELKKELEIMKKRIDSLLYGKKQESSVGKISECGVESSEYEDKIIHNYINEK